MDSALGRSVAWVHHDTMLGTRKLLPTESAYWRGCITTGNNLFRISELGTVNNDLTGVEPVATTRASAIPDLHPGARRTGRDTVQGDPLGGSRNQLTGNCTASRAGNPFRAGDGSLCVGHFRHLLSFQGRRNDVPRLKLQVGIQSPAAVQFRQWLLSLPPRGRSVWRPARVRRGGQLPW
jgi:hypothetical protein